MKQQTGSSRGFTLIELMAAIAIVGVLAAIAIPNYIKYQRKARQSEGKIMLGTGYIAQSTLKNSDIGGSYSACTRSIMVNNEGLVFYSVGFSDSAGALTTCTPQGNAALVGTVGTVVSGCDAYSWRRNTTGSYVISAVCVAGDFSLITTNRATPTSAAPATTSDLGNALTWNTFEMVSAGSIGGALLDKWGIDESKHIYHLQDGVDGN